MFRFLQTFLWFGMVYSLSLFWVSLGRVESPLPGKVGWDIRWSALWSIYMFFHIIYIFILCSLFHEHSALDYAPCSYIFSKMSRFRLAPGLKRTPSAHSLEINIFSKFKSRLSVTCTKWLWKISLQIEITYCSNFASGSESIQIIILVTFNFNLKF